MQINLIFPQGRQFPDANLPGVPADQTRAIFEAAIRTLVQLQTVNTDGLHLEGLGDKENYFQARVHNQKGFNLKNKNTFYKTNDTKQNNSITQEQPVTSRRKPAKLS